MKLAEVTHNGRTVQMYYNEKLGYSVYHRDSWTEGETRFIPTRQKAEEAFVWVVGYNEWRTASEKAFAEARESWQAEHQTLESVGATDFTP